MTHEHLCCVLQDAISNEAQDDVNAGGGSHLRVEVPAPCTGRGWPRLARSVNLPTSFSGNWCGPYLHSNTRRHSQLGDDLLPVLLWWVACIVLRTASLRL